MTLQDYQTFVDKKLTERDILTKQLDQKQGEVFANKIYLERLMKARWCLAEVSKLTQQKVSSHIESLVTMALQSVYDRPFQFIVDFDIKRNKSECQMTLYEGSITSREEMIENSFIPREESGGGILDVISLALRVVLWTIQNPRSRNVFWLDEPGKFLGDLIDNFGKMLKEISSKLNIQLVIITHDQRLKEFADRSWSVRMINGQSVVDQDGIAKENHGFKKILK